MYARKRHSLSSLLERAVLLFKKIADSAADALPGIFRNFEIQFLMQLLTVVYANCK